MKQSNRHKFLAALTVTFLSLVSNLTFTSNSWAEKQPEQKPHIINFSIEYFSTDDDLKQDQMLVDIRKSQNPLESLKKILVALNYKDNIVVRRNAFRVLGIDGIGIKWDVIIKNKDSSETVKKTVDILLKSLDKEQEKDYLIRRYAANGITVISRIEGFYVDSNVVDSLTKALRSDPYSPVQKNTADALKTITEKNINDLDDKHRNQILDASIYALKIQDKDQNPDYIYARRAAAYTLGSLGSPSEQSIKALLTALKDADLEVRRNAAYALGELSFQMPGRDVFDALVDALADEEERNYDSQMLRNTIDTINKVADRTLESTISSFLENDLKFYRDKLSDVEPKFRKALESEKLAKNKREKDNLKVIGEGKINGIKEHIRSIDKELNRRNSWLKFVKENPVQVVVFIVVLLCCTGYYGIYLIKPLKLLKLDEFLRPISISISRGEFNINISLRSIILFKYSDRVLDSFVKAYLPALREEFERIPTVSDRQTHVSIPIFFGKETNSRNLSSKDLQDGFKRYEPLLIWGESGSGKTNLACHIARWAMSDNQNERLCKHSMLPVIIEGELNSHNVQQEDAFIAAILGQLKRLLCNNKDRLDKDLLEKLLSRQRVLVIVDRFSEMSEETRQNIRLDKDPFIVNALIITSRKSPTEELSNIPKTTIETCRLEYDTLSQFMADYLREKGRFDWFNNDEFQTACQKLTRMVGKGKNITPMLATLYIDQLIEAKARSQQVFKPQLPDNVPYLMMNYLEQLNDKVLEAEKQNFHVLQKVAKALAWEYLKTDYHPKPLPREVTMNTISNEAQGTSVTLNYLVDYLNLVQPVGMGDRFKFALDPIAEYLAAFHLLSLYGSDGTKWAEFLDQKNTHNIPESFLIAVQDWCLVEGNNYQIPKFVRQKLDDVKHKETKVPEFLIQEFSPAI